MEIFDYLSWLNVRMEEGGQQEENRGAAVVRLSLRLKRFPGAEKGKEMYPPSFQKEICSVHILIFNTMRSISDVYTP